MSLYHVTTLQAVSSIIENGLVPTIGPRSAKLNEPRAAIYLFPTLEHVEEALSNWLGDEFDDEDELAVIEIDREAVVPDTEFEVIVYDAICPSEITAVLNEEFEAIEHVNPSTRLPSASKP